MLSSLIESAADVLKLAPRYFAPVGLVTGALLFAPAEFLQLLGVAQLTQDHRPVIGLAFLFCCAVLLVAAWQWLFAPLRNARRKRKFEGEMRERLGRLTEDEKQVLRFYIAHQTRANKLRLDDGVVQGLVAARIIYRSANVGDVIEGFAHNINEIAWKMLNEDHALLMGGTDTYRTDKRPHGRLW